MRTKQPMQLNRSIAFPALALVVLLTASCRKDKGYPAETIRMGGSACDTVNIRYTTFISSTMQQNCISCHAPGSSYSNLSTYAALVPFAQNGELVKHLKGTGGFSKMPPAGTLSDCQISTVEYWISKGCP